MDKRALIFDIVVIGAGVIGSGIAQFLALNNKNVLLIDRTAAGSAGATAYSGGIVRAYDPDDALMLLSCLGLPYLQEWDSMGMPGASPFTQSGTLYIMKDIPDNNIKIEAACSVLTDNGQAARLVTRKEIANLVPGANMQRNMVGLYEPKGGYGDPRLHTRNMVHGFIKEGGTLFENCLVEKIYFDNDVWKIETKRGSIIADRVVMACGAYLPNLVNGLPIHTQTIPLTQCYASDLNIELPVIDEETENFIRPIRGGKFYAGSRVVNKHDSPCTVGTFTNEIANDSVGRLQSLFSGKKNIEVLNGFVGFDCYTDDFRPLLGFTDNKENCFIATGFSGRGYKFSCAVAKIVSDSLEGKEKRFLPENIITQWVA